MKSTMIVCNFLDSISFHWDTLSTTQKGLLIVGILFVGFVIWKLVRRYY